jgi:hypothetical protein
MPAKTRRPPYVALMVSNEASEFGPDDWSWAIEAVVGELADLGPGMRAAVAQRLAARLGYIETDPLDERWRLMCRLSKRLCEAALDRAA